MAPVAVVGMKEVFPLYKLSYQWYSVIAMETIIIVGLIVSFLTGHQNHRDLDAKLLSPAIRKLAKRLPIKYRNFFQCNFKEQENEFKTSKNESYDGTSTTKL